MKCMAIPKHKNPNPGGQIYNFGRTFLVNYFYALCLSEQCPRIERNFKEIIHFHYMTYMATPPSTKTPAPGAMKFTLLVDLPWS